MVPSSAVRLMASGGYTTAPAYIYCQAINVDKVGATDEKVVLWTDKGLGGNRAEVMMFFRGR